MVLSWGESSTLGMCDILCHDTVRSNSIPSSMFLSFFFSPSSHVSIHISFLTFLFLLLPPYHMVCFCFAILFYYRSLLPSLLRAFFSSVKLFTPYTLLQFFFYSSPRQLSLFFIHYNFRTIPSLHLSPLLVQFFASSKKSSILSCHHSLILTTFFNF